jgi:NAD(P)-dependent dehydrogenase (short-subunit alcohol dehydrogenase family)
VAYLRSAGARAIACDLRKAEVEADLATAAGRASLVEAVTRLSGGRLDGVVANAGGGPAETMVALNFFGATATLEGLRPLLAASRAPRAVAVSSISALGPFDESLVQACLGGDEPAAGAAAAEALRVGKGPLVLYGSAKRALNLWARKAACEARWAEAGITLNAVAPGVIDTPAAAWLLSNPELRSEGLRRTPLTAAYPGRPEQMAALLAWCVSAENALMTGQVLFADAGFEARARGEAAW